MLKEGEAKIRRQNIKNDNFKKTMEIKNEIEKKEKEERERRSGDKNNIFTYYEQNEKYIKNDVSLVVKNEDEESESYIKNNNTQEVQLYDYGNNSLNIGNKDKMSDNEYLQIIILIILEIVYLI